MFVIIMYISDEKLKRGGLEFNHSINPKLGSLQLSNTLRKCKQIQILHLNSLKEDFTMAQQLAVPKSFSHPTVCEPSSRWLKYMVPTSPRQVTYIATQVWGGYRGIDR